MRVNAVAMQISGSQAVRPVPVPFALGWLDGKRAQMVHIRSRGRLSAVQGVAHKVIVAAVASERPDLEEEHALCDAAHAGDRRALGKILRKYGPVLFRAVLMPRLGSEALAQDALGETYARVVERFHQFHWQPCGVYPWLRVIAMRIALDILRSKRRETLFEPDDLQREIDASEQDPSLRGDVLLCEKHDLADARARVDAALAALNPRYAKAIRLRILEERPRDEVAEALGVTVATFDVVLHRALSALKKNLAKGDASATAEAQPRSNP